MCYVDKVVIVQSRSGKNSTLHNQITFYKHEYDTAKQGRTGIKWQSGMFSKYSMSKVNYGLVIE